MTSPFLLAAVALVVTTSVGCSKSASGHADDSKVVAAAAPAAGSQVVAVVANEDGFSPNHVELKRGGKATLQFKRTTDQTCANAVVFPDLGINKELPLNQTVSIEIPADQARTLTFQCGMGMYKSKVVVL